jgi:hypothetical protein
LSGRDGGALQGRAAGLRKLALHLAKKFRSFCIIYLEFCRRLTATDMPISKDTPELRRRAQDILAEQHFANLAEQRRINGVVLTRKLMVPINAMGF